MGTIPAQSIQALGLGAAALTTIAFAPQLMKTRRTGGGDLSWGMLLLFGSGVTLWFLYGLLLPSWPVALANAATGAQVLVIVFLKGRGSA